jgi:hypothetical protein
MSKQDLYELVLCIFTVAMWSWVFVEVANF